MESCTLLLSLGSALLLIGAVAAAKTKNRWFAVITGIGVFLIVVGFMSYVLGLC